MVSMITSKMVGSIDLAITYIVYCTMLIPMYVQTKVSCLSLISIQSYGKIYQQIYWGCVKLSTACAPLIWMLLFECLFFIFCFVIYSYIKNFNLNNLNLLQIRDTNIVLRNFIINIYIHINRIEFTIYIEIGIRFYSMTHFFANVSDFLAR